MLYQTRIFLVQRTLSGDKMNLQRKQGCKRLQGNSQNNPVCLTAATLVLFEYDRT